MTRLLVCLKLLTIVGSMTFFACGPRLKPVEYEEPKLSGSGAPDDGEPSSSRKSSKSTSSADDTASSSGSGSSSSGKSGASKSCEDKASTCGSSCTECPPGNMDCMEVLIEKQCNLEHKCVPAPANCTAPEKSEKSKKGDKK